MSKLNIHTNSIKLLSLGDSFYKRENNLKDSSQENYREVKKRFNQEWEFEGTKVNGFKNGQKVC
jgi:hypothetical protein